MPSLSAHPSVQPALSHGKMGQKCYTPAVYPAHLVPCMAVAFLLASPWKASKQRAVSQWQVGFSNSQVGSHVHSSLLEAYLAPSVPSPLSKDRNPASISRHLVLFVI